MLRELFEQKVVFPGHYIALSSVVSLPGSDCVVEVLFLSMDLSQAEDGIFPLIGREVLRQAVCTLAKALAGQNHHHANASIGSCMLFLDSKAVVY